MLGISDQMQAKGRHIAGRNVGRSITPTLALLVSALQVSGCAPLFTTIEGARVAAIGKETARGEVQYGGQTFGYVYRRKGTPLSRQLVSYPGGRKVYQMEPALWDEGVPIVEISSGERKLGESDEPAARGAALALCEAHPGWRREAIAAAAKIGQDDDFLNEGVWSFVMVCK